MGEPFKSAAGHGIVQGPWNGCMTHEKLWDYILTCMGLCNVHAAGSHAIVEWSERLIVDWEVYFRLHTQYSWVMRLLVWLTAILDRFSNRKAPLASLILQFQIICFI